jgi:protein subunit release factor A
MLDQLEAVEARFQEVEAQLQDPAVVSATPSACGS